MKDSTILIIVSIIGYIASVFVIFAIIMQDPTLRPLTAIFRNTLFQSLAIIAWNVAGLAAITYSTLIVRMREKEETEEVDKAEEAV